MFHYQNLLGGHLGGKHPHKPGRSRPELYWYDFSIVCRTQWDIFGRSFHAVKILLQVSASWDWFLDLYVVVQSERCPEMANRQEASELTALKTSSEGAGIQRPLRFRVDAEICARHWPLGPEAHKVDGVGRAVPWGRRRKTDTVKWGVDCSTSGGEVLIGLSPRAIGLLPCNLRNNNGPQIRFTLRRLFLSVLSVSTFLGGEAR